jgi:diaminohydroxyphosphoribosylaminopyrimidine deaminase/5-amino-6-(5-phosphoribosylamino)uracil reductase
MSDEYRARTLIREGNFEKILRDLVQEQGVMSVMVEAGGDLVAELWRQKLVDEWVCYLAPLLTGGKVAVAGLSDLNAQLRDVEWSRLGEDVKMRALVKH